MARHGGTWFWRDRFEQLYGERFYAAKDVAELRASIRRAGNDEWVERELHDAIGGYLTACRQFKRWTQDIPEEQWVWLLGHRKPAVREWALLELGRRADSPDR